MARSTDPSTRADDLKWLGYDTGPAAHNPEWWGYKNYGPIFDMIDNNPPQGKNPAGTHEMKYQLDHDSLGDDGNDDPGDMNDDHLNPDDEPEFAGRQLAMMEPRGRSDAMSDQELMNAIAESKMLGRGNPYRGQKGSPDLPSSRDRQSLENNPTDSGYSQFVDRFGFEAMDPRYGSDPNYIPTPRPRHPDLDYNNPIGPSPLSMDEISRQGADFRPQDIDRMRRERLQHQDDIESETGTYPEDLERPDAPGMSEEEIQELIQRGLAGPRRR